MNFVRLVVFGFLALGVIYVLISVYSRSIRREKLEDHWDETPPDNAPPPAPEPLVPEGMAQTQG